MGTIINSVAFENFYNYYGSYKANEYKFKSGLNIVNADNNMGKTKFFNGFMWMLRDQVYDSDNEAFADANESLVKMASGKAKAEDRSFKVGFRVVFTNGDVEYTVEKYSDFSTLDGELLHTPSMMSVFKKENNADTPVLDKDEQMDIINRVFIPLTIRNYALLQGESMDRLVNLSSKKEALSDTIDTLAGISVLKGICYTSREMAKKADSLYQAKDSENSKNDIAKQKEKENRSTFLKNIEKLMGEIEAAKDELNAAKVKKEELDAYISNSSKRIEIRSRLDANTIAIKNVKKSIDNIEMSITKRLFDEENPWLLMGLQDELEAFDAKREKHIGELARMNDEGALVIMLPEGSPDTSSLERMLKTEVCEVCGQKAHKGSNAWNHIKMILDRPKKVCTTRNDFGHFYGTLQKSASSYLMSIPRLNYKIEDVKVRLDKMKDNLEELEEKKNDNFTELNNAGGNADNSEYKDRNIVADYRQVNSVITEKENEINRKNKMVAKMEDALAAINQKLSSYKKAADVEKYEEFAQVLEKINKIIEETKDDIFDRTIETLAKNANEKYKALTSGNQSSGGILDFQRDHDVVNVTIRDVNNGEITGLGKGFQRMKQLSIVMAVISSKIGNEKKFDYPFISDAPFSEFGENFINNFFAVAPEVFSQSIIMIKDLYNPNADDLLTPFGRRILDKMNKGQIPGTFYVNVIEEKADTTDLVTTHKCYKY